MIYVLAENEEKLQLVENNPNFQKVNLSLLDVGKYQLNCLAENRIFLSELPETPTVGFATARWDQKYKHKISKLESLSPTGTSVYVADLTGKEWAFRSDTLHPGMYKLLQELSSFSGLPLDAGETFYSNNFVCSWEVFADFSPFWKKCFHHFFDKYGPNLPFKNCWSGYKQELHPAYFFERITMLYFANHGSLIQL